MYFPKFNQKLVDVYALELKNIEQILKKTLFKKKNFFFEISSKMSGPSCCGPSRLLGLWGPKLRHWPNCQVMSLYLCFKKTQFES